MRNSRTHSVTLGPLEASLQRRLESGEYDNASEVLRTALRALDREEAMLDEILREKGQGLDGEQEAKHSG